jgi:hypothetical protein
MARQARVQDPIDDLLIGWKKTGGGEAGRQRARRSKRASAQATSRAMGMKNRVMTTPHLKKAGLIRPALQRNSLCLCGA